MPKQHLCSPRDSYESHISSLRDSVDFSHSLSVPCASANSCCTAFNRSEEEEKTLINVIVLAELVFLKVIIFHLFSCKGLGAISF